jgi:NitT/TauT family transport system ATP-binding protein
MALLTFRDVWVEYGDKVVLERVDLSIEQGSFVSIVGPSGAGKSTFLRLALGQEAPTKGAIDLDGRKLRAEPGPDRGVVFQKYSVFPHLNARDNVVFGLDCEGSPLRGRLSGAKRRAAEAQADLMLAAVGLRILLAPEGTGRAHVRRPMRLSGVVEREALVGGLE